MTETDQGPLVVGSKVIGPKHEAVDKPCQDAWATKQIGPDSHVIAVGDGVGSSKKSHEGSQLATTTAVTSLVEKLGDTEQIDPTQIEPKIKESIVSARSAVKAMAERAEEDHTEFDSTLLVAVVTPAVVAGAVVGDGGIVCDTGDSYKLLVPREESVVDLPASNVTIPLLHDDWEMSYRFGSLDGYEGVAVFTDGLENFIWAGSPVNDQFFDATFPLIRKSENRDDATQNLQELLTNERVSNFGDDKTLVIAEKTKPEEWTEADLESQDETKIKIDESETPNEDTKDDNSLNRKTVQAGSDTVTVGKEITSGAEGSVYYIQEEFETSVVKIFREEVREQKSDKIRAMIDNQPDDPIKPDFGFRSIIWPEVIVEDADTGEFLGYKMPYRNFSEAENVHSHAINELKWDTSKPEKRYSTALSLALAVHQIHDQGHGIGDFDHNSFIIIDNITTLIDCDSFMISDGNTIYPSDSYYPRYTPPEGRPQKPEEIQEFDRFGLGVHIYQLLMAGFHPYQVVGPEATNDSIEDWITENKFPHDNTGYEPPDKAPNYEELPEVLRSLFSDCFSEENKHTDGDYRPSPYDWINAFAEVLDFEKHFGLNTLQSTNNSFEKQSHVNKRPNRNSDSQNGNVNDNGESGVVRSGVKAAKKKIDSVGKKVLEKEDLDKTSNSVDDTQPKNENTVINPDDEIYTEENNNEEKSQKKERDTSEKRNNND